MAEIKPIRSVKDYETALDRISELMGAAYGSPEGLELDILADYVVEYEGAHVPMIPYRSREKGSGVDPGELAERYPRLFHMAAAGSWPSIERHGLLSTSALLDISASRKNGESHWRHAIVRHRFRYAVRGLAAQSCATRDR